VTPEAQTGGPIALVHNDDEITINAETREISLHVPEIVQAARAQEWKAPALKYTKGVLFKYTQLVKSASEGCVTDEE
jgi:dihydroxy-acid dehydratase